MIKCMFAEVNYALKSAIFNELLLFIAHTRPSNTNALFHHFIAYSLHHCVEAKSRTLTCDWKTLLLQTRRPGSPVTQMTVFTLPMTTLDSVWLQLHKQRNIPYFRWPLCMSKSMVPVKQSQMKSSSHSSHERKPLNNRICQSQVSVLALIFQSQIKSVSLSKTFPVRFPWLKTMREKYHIYK